MSGCRGGCGGRSRDEDRCTSFARDGLAASAAGFSRFRCAGARPRRLWKSSRKVKSVHDVVSSYAYRLLLGNSNSLIRIDTDTFSQSYELKNLFNRSVIYLKKYRITL